MNASHLMLALCMLAIAGCTHNEPDPPTPLMRAAQAGDVVGVRALVAAGADVNAARGVHRAPGMRIHGDNPQHGETALLYAVAGGKVEAARALLDAGARTDVVDTAANTIWSKMDGRIGAQDDAAMLQLLLARSQGPAPSTADHLLALGMTRGRPALVLLLLERVEDPMAAYCHTTSLDDAQFRSMMALLEQRIGAPKGRALECSLHTDTPAKLAWFLARGADPNHLGERFRPLGALVFDASQRKTLTDREREMIKVLLRHGANPALADRTGNGSAIDMARRGGNAELLALLTGPRN